MDDTSLDEFLDGRGGETTGNGSDGEPNESGNDTGDTADAQATGVDPAVTTLQWSPDGSDCEVCGTTVSRRWHAETGMVCTDCKEW